MTSKQGLTEQDVQTIKKEAASLTPTKTPLTEQMVRYWGENNKAMHKELTQKGVLWEFARRLQEQHDKEVTRLVQVEKMSQSEAELIAKDLLVMVPEQPEDEME